MKNKKWISLAAAVVLAVTALPMGVFAAKKDSTEEKLTKVTLNEVAHSIFYAPQYVAIEEGYFKDEGLDLTLVTGFGADKTMTAVISGEADIGFMGAEASVYAYQEGATDAVVNFAQLTQRAGNFLVAREEMPDFKWEDLKDKKVLGGRKGGMPEMVFEYILRKNGLDPQKDLTIDQSIDFGYTAAAFTGDTSADFTVEFEPSATALEKEGAGYVVASLGVDSGYVPYTSYSAKTSYMEKNPEIIQKFTNALQKGMEYVQSHTPEEIAEKEEIMENALNVACGVPIEIMKTCARGIDLVEVFAAKGSRIALSDAGVGATLLKSAMQGASLNVYINTKSMKDRKRAEELNQLADSLREEYEAKADRIFAEVSSRIR